LKVTHNVLSPTIFLLAKRVPQQRGLKVEGSFSEKTGNYALQKEFLSNED